jgi:hypothetical protein
MVDHVKGAEEGEVVAICRNGCCPSLVFRGDGAVEVIEDGLVLVTLTFELADNAARELTRRGYGR